MMKKLTRSGLILLSVMLGSFIIAELPSEVVKQITIADSLTFTGTVEAVNSGTASSQTSGRVVEALVDVGDLVNKDDVILKLRDTQQRANYDSAAASVKSAKAQYDSAEKEFIRISDILKKGLVSKSVGDSALSHRDSTKAAWEASRANLKHAEEQLEYTRIRAPYSGIVLERHVEVGETVNLGTPLYTGMSLEFLRVIAEVPQKDIDKIRLNKTAIIELPNGTKVNVSGENLTFYGHADPATSTFKIRVNLPEGIEGLYPGMYLKTTFVVGETTSLVTSKNSVIRRGEVTAVYVQKNTRLDFRHIRIGRELDNDKIEILSGLSDGELIVTSPSLAIAFIQSQKLESANSSDDNE